MPTQHDGSRAGPILRLFEVRAKANNAAELLARFATTSAQVVLGEPGNEGYFFGREIAVDTETVLFASVWRDLDAVKARFGDDWQVSLLPEGYEAHIETCSVRHVDLSNGWHVDAVP
ncbi:MAG: antibiotic biosynthesis monooxygenase [Acidimicrobiia bacterium]|nr:antibiotic biosynthesis monooxygenase [Acidimicrobiia bacterium]